MGLHELIELEVIWFYQFLSAFELDLPRTCGITQDSPLYMEILLWMQILWIGRGNLKYFLMIILSWFIHFPIAVVPTVEQSLVHVNFLRTWQFLLLLQILFGIICFDVLLNQIFYFHVLCTFSRVLSRSRWVTW